MYIKKRGAATFLLLIDTRFISYTRHKLMLLLCILVCSTYMEPGLVRFLRKGDIMLISTGKTS